MPEKNQVTTAAEASILSTSTTPTFDVPDGGDDDDSTTPPAPQDNPAVLATSSLPSAAVATIPAGDVVDKSTSLSPLRRMQEALQLWQRRTEIVSREFARLQLELLLAMADAPSAAVGGGEVRTGNEGDVSRECGGIGAESTTTTALSPSLRRCLSRSMRCQASRIAELEARVYELEQQQIFHSLTLVSPFAAAGAANGAAAAQNLAEAAPLVSNSSSPQRGLLPHWSPPVAGRTPLVVPPQVPVAMMEATQRPSQLDVGELSSQPPQYDEQHHDDATWSPGNVTVAAAAASTPMRRAAASPSRSVALSLSPIGSTHPHQLPPRGRERSGAGGLKQSSEAPTPSSSPSSSSVPRAKYDAVKAKYHALKREYLWQKVRAEEAEASWVAQYLQHKQLYGGCLRTIVRVPPEGHHGAASGAAATWKVSDLGAAGWLEHVTISLGSVGSASSVRVDATSSSPSPSPSSSPYRIQADAFVGRSTATWDFAQSLVREEVAPAWRVGGAVVLIFSGGAGSGRTSLMFDVAVSALEWLMTLVDDAPPAASAMNTSSTATTARGPSTSWQVDATVADTDDMWSLESRVVENPSPSLADGHSPSGRISGETIRRQHSTSVLGPIFHQRRASYRDSHLVVSISPTRSTCAPRLTLVDVQWIDGSSNSNSGNAFAQCERDLVALMCAVREGQLRQIRDYSEHLCRTFRHHSSDNGVGGSNDDSVVVDASIEVAGDGNFGGRSLHDAYESCNPLCCLLHPRLTQNRVTHAVLVASVAPHGDPSDNWRTLSFASRMRSAAALRRRCGGGDGGRAGGCPPYRQTSEQSGLEYHTFDDDSLLFVEGDFRR